MIILSTTSDVIRIVTSLAIALDVHASFVDNTTSAYTPGRQNTAITTATTATVLSAPAASTQRQLKKLTANAKGGAQTVTVQYFDGTTAFQALTIFLGASETLEYEDLQGWRVLDANGQLKTTGVGSGRLLRARQVLTSGSSITHPTGTATIYVRGVGGGGAGGGVPATAQAIGASGGSGTYGEKTFVAGAATSTFAIGAAGTGVSGAGGGNGGSSTFTHNGLTMTLPGGNGGTINSGAAPKTTGGGTVASAATNADFSISGQAGGDAINNSAPIFSFSGDGGSSPLGSGGRGHSTVASVVLGSIGLGAGSGGSGVLNGTNATASAGANGAAGVFIVEEYS